jgi:hypothetical protein
VHWTKTCQRRRVGVDRVERAGEEEHRHDRQLHVVEVAPLAHERRGRQARSGETRTRRPSRPGKARTASGELSSPPQAGQAGDDDQEPDGVQPAPQQRPHDLAPGDVGQRHRRRDDGVVELGVLELVEEVVRGLVDGAVHGRGSEQRRCATKTAYETLCRCQRDVADQRAHAETHREEIEERLEEAREDDHEGMAVDERVALDYPQRPNQCERRSDAPGQHQTTSLRRKVMRPTAIPTTIVATRNDR